LALRETAHEVGQRIGNGAEVASGKASTKVSKHHKILVLITASPKTAMLIRRAKRVSDFLGAECFAVAVEPSGDLSGLSETEREAVERHLNFARGLHIETRILDGDDVAAALVDFGRRNQVTQIFVTRPHRRPWLPGLSRDPVHRIVDLAKDMQIVIVSDREPASR
jgi:two-component system sensor histidine kinase KdpD